jgi:hypothetical protein
MPCVYQNIDPPPPSPPGRGVHSTHSPGGEGGGGQYFGRRKTQLCTISNPLWDRPFFCFLRMFSAILAKKIANIRQKYFLLQNFNLGIKKSSIQCWSNCKKVHSTKHYFRKPLHVVIIVKNSFSVRVFVDNCFRKFFLNIFSSDLKWASNCAFFYSHIWGQHRTKGLKTKWKTSVLNVS